MPINLFLNKKKTCLSVHVREGFDKQKLFKRRLGNTTLYADRQPNGIKTPPTKVRTVQLHFNKNLFTYCWLNCQYFPYHDCLIIRIENKQ